MANRVLFALGQMVATHGALNALAAAKSTGVEYVGRHASGDWGELSPEDVQENERSLKDGCRLMSAYTLPTGVKLWVITEADRSATTLLLPEEY